MDRAIAEAIIPLRNVRRLKPGMDNDFEIKKSDSVLKELEEMTSGIRIGTIVIAMMTLLGAAIGLMNIMLVSVTERTKEIGVSKALGAKRENILYQFLTEAVVICQAGGLVGILLGIGLGNGVSHFMNGPFIIPWNWFEELRLKDYLIIVSIIALTLFLFFKENVFNYFIRAYETTSYQIESIATLNHKKAIFNKKESLMGSSLEPIGYQLDLTYPYQEKIVHNSVLILYNQYPVTRQKMDSTILNDTKDRLQITYLPQIQKITMSVIQKLYLGFKIILH